MLLFVAILIILILYVIYVIYVIYATKPQRFFETKEIYAKLYNSPTDEIQKELYNITKTDTDWVNWPEKELWDHNKNSWKVFPIYGFNRWNKKNAEACPKTVQFIKSLGNNIISAGFSMLEPGVKLDVHRGWGPLSNNVLRSHLLLTNTNCTLYVDGETRNLIYKNWITFDDSLPHSAENLDKNIRIVFLVDMIRPSNVPKGNSDVPYSSELDFFVNKLLE